MSVSLSILDAPENFQVIYLEVAEVRPALSMVLIGSGASRGASASGDRCIVSRSALHLGSMSPISELQ